MEMENLRHEPKEEKRASIQVHSNLAIHSDCVKVAVALRSAATTLLDQTPHTIREIMGYVKHSCRLRNRMSWCGISARR